MRNDADTWTLVEDVTFATREAAKVCTWPKELLRREAAEIMHGYAASEVEYIAENGTQMIRGPWVTMRHRRGDCKSTAVLIASMCAAAGRKVQLKFLQYDDRNGDHWAHVYAVVDGTPVDPLLQFGEEFTYLRSHTVTIR